MICPHHPYPLSNKVLSLGEVLVRRKLSGEFWSKHKKVFSRFQVNDKSSSGVKRAHRRLAGNSELRLK